ncbi:MAG TPA: hypothetical protein VGP63_07405 [Planctomycetaceae bacterium]|nr:hypothetical protein [Planctomycetaceae bacterium]
MNGVATDIESSRDHLFRTPPDEVIEDPAFSGTQLQQSNFDRQRFQHVAKTPRFLFHLLWMSRRSNCGNHQRDTAESQVSAFRQRGRFDSFLVDIGSISAVQIVNDGRRADNGKLGV